MKYLANRILANLLSRVFEHLGEAFFITMFATTLFDDALSVEAYKNGLMKGTVAGIVFLVLAWQFADLGKRRKKK